MSDFKINVCYDPNTQTFAYTVDGGADADHCRACDTILWTLKKGCAGSALKIQFAKGDLFYPPTTDPQPDKKYTFSQKHSKSYKYTVSLTYNGKTVTDDPEIGFDDGNIETHAELDEATLKSLGTAAQSAFQGLLTDLKAAKAQRDPNALFFPGGINNIAVQVSVPVGLATASVSLTVSGSDPVALFPAPTAKK